MVTFAHSTWKVTLLGTMYGGAEEWSTGFYMGNVTPGDVGQAPTVADCQEVATAWQTFFTTANSDFSNNYLTIGCRIALTHEDGKADPAGTEYYYFPVPIQGINSNVKYPPQVALAATLTTDKVRGWGSKGRMYLPGISKLVTGDGRMSTTDATTIKTNFRTFINAVNTNNDHGYKVIVNSAAKTTTPTHAAEINEVTGVRIGTVFDTQRRRRNGLIEQYQSQTLA